MPTVPDLSLRPPLLAQEGLHGRSLGEAAALLAGLLTASRPLHCPEGLADCGSGWVRQSRVSSSTTCEHLRSGRCPLTAAFSGLPGCPAHTRLSGRGPRTSHTGISWELVECQQPGPRDLLGQDLHPGRSRGPMRTPSVGTTVLPGPHCAGVDGQIRG